MCFFCGVDNGVDVLELVPTVGGEDDDFEVFVEHVKAPSADDNFGASAWLSPSAAMGASL